MKTFKVNKNVNKQPYIFGLRLPLFYAFTGVIIVTIFSLISGVTLVKIVIATVALSISYLVLRKLNSGDLFGAIANDKFPNKVINDNYK